MESSEDDYFLLIFNFKKTITTKTSHMLIVKIIQYRLEWFDKIQPLVFWKHTSLAHRTPSAAHFTCKILQIQRSSSTFSSLGFISHPIF